MKTKLLFITFILMAIGLQSNAATVTWDGGAGTNNWTDPLNWDTDALPTASDDVDLNGATVVLSANATVQRVYAAGSSDLTIDAGVTLTVTGFAGGDDGLEIQGSATVLNNGTIAISNIFGTAGDGLYVKGVFTNSSTGNLSIDGTGEYNIYVQGGICTNNGAMALTNYGQANSDRDGIAVDDDGGSPGTFNNDAGSITITMNGGDDGIYVNDDSIFNNAAMLTVGGSVGDNGIRVDDGGAFNNNAGGTFTINSTPDDQLFIDLTGTFSNTGTVNLNNAADVGMYVTDDGVFTNNTAGMVNISSSSNYGIQVDANGGTGNIANNGTITIVGGSNDGVRLQEMGVFNNNAGATLNIDNAGDAGIQVDDATPVSTFNNSGLVYIINAADDGMELFGTFNNLTGGTYEALSSIDDGIRIRNTGIFNNDGAIQINGSGSDDIETDSDTGTTFSNTANATFAPGASPGLLEIKDDLDMGTATITFEIAGTTAITEFDQIQNFSAGTALTITNATANLDWGSYIPSVGDKFMVIDGSGDVTGTFSAVTTTNSDIVTTINYTATEVEIEVTSTLSIDDVNISDFKVYPNPANDFINIESKNIKVSSVDMYNVLGAKVLSSELTNNRVNVSNLVKGVYFMKINSEGGSATKKVVIQ